MKIAISVLVLIGLAVFVACLAYEALEAGA